MSELEDEPPADPGSPQEQNDKNTIRPANQLDPKVIQQLELGILRAAQSGGTVDPLFNAGLPDSSVTGTSSTSMSSSLYTTSTSVSMESFTIDTIVAGVSNPKDLELRPGGRRPAQARTTNCCCRAKVEPASLKPNDDSEANSGAGSLTQGLLPAPSLEDKNKLCLVLDLDETLVHSSFLAIPHADLQFVLDIEENQIPVFVCVRPGAQRFLKELGSLYEIVIFTASMQPYADPVIDFIDPDRVVKHRLYRESCTDFGGSFVKDLSRLNRKLERIIIIDNSPSAYLLQPYNAIAISSWFDEPMDDELLKILDFLKQSYRVTNVYDLFSSQ